MKSQRRALRPIALSAASFASRCAQCQIDRFLWKHSKEAVAFVEHLRHSLLVANQRISSTFTSN